MALLGQASGGFTESSSALRILHVGVRNTLGQLTADAFTQTNPPIETANAGRISTSAGMQTNVLGVLSGSIAFTRPDEGVNFHGGPSAANPAATERVLGIFINTASGNAFENQPGVASNRALTFLHRVLTRTASMRLMKQLATLLLPTVLVMPSSLL